MSSKANEAGAEVVVATTATNKDDDANKDKAMMDDDPAGVEARKTTSQEESPSSATALILLDAPHMKQVQTTHRLPGTYIGVRRIRPSSRHVARAAAKNNKPIVGTMIEPLPTIAFKVTDPTTGIERRMTAAEKRAVKQERQQQYQLRVQQAKVKWQEEKDRQQQENVNESTEQPQQEQQVEDDKQEPSLQERIAETAKTNQGAGAGADSETDTNKYFYFKTNPASLEQEVADLRGERSQVPPILLSPGQAHVAIVHDLVPGAKDIHATIITPPPQLDDGYAQEWATVLRESMIPAVETRKAEDMRAMVYDIVPQVWSRLRPTFGDVPTNNLLQESWQGTTTTTTTDETSTRMSLPCTLRPSLAIDGQWNVMIQALYRGHNIHIGCGAKFGCDILLYDGPRSKRHAFAGLRLVQATNPWCKFPLPRAYDLAGYVRCLNTAGKLALLATVVPARDDDKGYSIAIIDLALEKVDVKRKPKRAKTLEERLITLAKTKS